MTRELRCYDYVNSSYQDVCSVLRTDARGLFLRATDDALRANIAGLDLTVPIAIQLGEVSVIEAYGIPATRFPLSWKGAHRTWLFPTMTANLDVYALSSNETQLDFQGVYDPPLGVIGELGDALVAHRIAEATVKDFLRTVAAHMRAQAA
jgi:hypothetical protein